MARFLLTGAAGFVGYWVSSQLLASGEEVVGVDNLNDAYDPLLKHWRLKALQAEPNFRFERVDITDRDALAGVFASKRFDAVIHLAARAGAGESVRNPGAYLDSNCLGTLNVLEQCRDRDVGKLVLASTSSVYGSRNPLPFREDAETDRPLSPYAASKKAAEMITHVYHRLHGIDVTVLRYFTVFGPAGRPDMSLFRFIHWIREQRPVILHGDGSQSRDFTYVGDIARGTVAGLKPVGFEVINLGSGSPVQLLSAMRMIEDRLGQKARIRREPLQQTDVPGTRADISKAQRLLEWRPETSFRQGIESTVQWYLENRIWARRMRT